MAKERIKAIMPLTKSHFQYLFFSNMKRKCDFGNPLIGDKVSTTSLKIIRAPYQSEGKRTKNILAI
ncbi:hypothetical protein B1F79_01920 [Coxiella-like endosymbiont of Rhipicephalus sanguineus]|nr:hypothetical protein [Coxiella-like endosymbiont of Rhipicephalus sanguineus]